MNLIIYFKFENQVYGLSALGRRGTEGRTDHSIDSNPGLPSACFAFYHQRFVAASILYDFVQSLFHIFVTAVKCINAVQSFILGAVLFFYFYFFYFKQL